MNVLKDKIKTFLASINKSLKHTLAEYSSEFLPEVIRSKIKGFTE